MLKYLIPLLAVANVAFAENCRVDQSDRVRDPRYVFTDVETIGAQTFGDVIASNRSHRTDVIHVVTDANASHIYGSLGSFGVDKNVIYGPPTEETVVKGTLINEGLYPNEFDKPHLLATLRGGVKEWQCQYNRGCERLFTGRKVKVCKQDFFKVAKARRLQKSRKFLYLYSKKFVGFKVK